MVGDQAIAEPTRVIQDRKSAIEYAVSLAGKGDSVAILGKGHELGQEISGEKFDFDDRKVLAQAIAGQR
jgi:UDP-N-acetylmuramoyl-L-alanyl-D-glutamate--2,6-diaminopimelate ligase